MATEAILNGDIIVLSPNDDVHYTADKDVYLFINNKDIEISSDRINWFTFITNTSVYVKNGDTIYIKNKSNDVEYKIEIIDLMPGERPSENTSVGGGELIRFDDNGNISYILENEKRDNYTYDGINSINTTINKSDITLEYFKNNITANHSNSKFYSIYNYENFNLDNIINSIDSFKYAINNSNISGYTSIINSNASYLHSIDSYVTSYVSIGVLNSSIVDSIEYSNIVSNNSIFLNIFNSTINSKDSIIEYNHNSRCSLIDSICVNLKSSDIISEASILESITMSSVNSFLSSTFNKFKPDVIEIVDNILKIYTIKDLTYGALSSKVGSVSLDSYVTYTEGNYSLCKFTNKTVTDSGFVYDVEIYYGDNISSYTLNSINFYNRESNALNYGITSILYKSNIHNSNTCYINTKSSHISNTHNGTIIGNGNEINDSKNMSITGDENYISITNGSVIGDKNVAFNIDDNYSSTQIIGFNNIILENGHINGYNNAIISEISNVNKSIVSNMTADEISFDDMNTFSVGNTLLLITESIDLQVSAYIELLYQTGTSSFIYKVLYIKDGYTIDVFYIHNKTIAILEDNEANINSYIFGMGNTSVDSNNTLLIGSNNTSKVSTSSSVVGASNKASVISSSVTGESNIVFGTYSSISGYSNLTLNNNLIIDGSLIKSESDGLYILANNVTAYNDINIGDSVEIVFDGESSVYSKSAYVINKDDTNGYKIYITDVVNIESPNTIYIINVTKYYNLISSDFNYRYNSNVNIIGKYNKIVGSNIKVFGNYNNFINSSDVIIIGDNAIETEDAKVIIGIGESLFSKTGMVVYSSGCIEAPESDDFAINQSDRSLITKEYLYSTNIKQVDDFDAVSGDSIFTINNIFMDTDVFVDGILKRRNTYTLYQNTFSNTTIITLNTPLAQDSWVSIVSRMLVKKTNDNSWAV